MIQFLKVDYSATYRPVLDEIKKVIIDNCQNGGPYGISENPFLTGRLSDYGYIIQDFSGDGIPELIIGQMNNYKGGVSNILALYTLTQNKPVNVFYGESRLCSYYAGGSTFIYAGSCAAFYTSIGLFTLSKDGRNLNFSEYYYVEQVSAYPIVVKNTYSSTGPDDPGKYVGKEEIFKSNRERIISKAHSLNLIPLSQWK